MAIAPGPGWAWENEKEQSGRIVPATDECDCLAIVLVVSVILFFIIFIGCNCWGVLH